MTGPSAETALLVIAALAVGIANAVTLYAQYAIAIRFYRL